MAQAMSKAAQQLLKAQLRRKEVGDSDARKFVTTEGRKLSTVNLLFLTLKGSGASRRPQNRPLRCLATTTFGMRSAAREPKASSPLQHQAGIWATAHQAACAAARPDDRIRPAERS